MIQRRSGNLILWCDICLAIRTRSTPRIKGFSTPMDEANLRHCAMGIGWFRGIPPGGKEVLDWCQECAADHPMAIAVRPRKPSPAKGVAGG